MARPLKPLVHSGGWYPSKKWIPLVRNGGYTTANGGEQPEPEAVLKTVTGSLIHITDALALPAEALTVNVEPNQDLHGYDSPWPAGGGVNKINYLSCVGVGARDGTESIYNNNTSISGTELTINQAYGNNGGILKGVGTFSLATGEYVTISGKATLVGSSNLVVGIANYNGGGTSNIKAFVTVTDGKFSVTLNAKSDYAKTGIFLQPSRVNSSMIVSDVMVALGQTEQPYSPYSNICPISGRTSATVTRTGRNLLDVTGYGGAFFNAPVGANLAQERNVVANQTIDGFDLTISLEWNGKVFSTPILPPGTYNFHVKTDSANIRGVCYVTDSNFIVKRTIKYVNAIGSFDAQANITKGERIAVFITSIQRETISVHDFQVEVGSSFSSYEPYQGNTYTIQLGDTVYGGMLDVTQGKMVVDRAMVDLGTLNWAIYSSPDRHVFRADYPPPRPYIGNNALLPHAICSSYYPMAYNPISYNDNGAFSLGNGRVVVIDHRFSDATSFGSAVNGVQLVYELATPFEITLTPTQIDMLLGENNLWADAGDLTLTYYADGNASTSEALGILLGGTYNNPGGADDVSDDEALGILLGGS